METDITKDFNYPVFILYDMEKKVPIANGSGKFVYSNKTDARRALTCYCSCTKHRMRRQKDKKYVILEATTKVYSVSSRNYKLQWEDTPLEKFMRTRNKTCKSCEFKETEIDPLLIYCSKKRKVLFEEEPACKDYVEHKGRTI